MAITITGGITISGPLPVTAVTSGLVLNLDAGDAASYPGSAQNG